MSLPITRSSNAPRARPSSSQMPGSSALRAGLMAHVVDNVMHARLRLCDDTTGRRRSVRRGTASEPSWGRTACVEGDE